MQIIENYRAGILNEDFRFFKKGTKFNILEERETEYVIRLYYNTPAFVIDKSKIDIP